ncbi:hypothetical protein NKI72_34935, partial [Mesorhizobium sp. M0437]
RTRREQHQSVAGHRCRTPAQIGLYQIRQQSAPTDAWTTEIKGTDAEGKRVEDNAGTVAPDLFLTFSALNL